MPFRFSLLLVLQICLTTYRFFFTHAFVYNGCHHVSNNVKKEFDSKIGSRNKRISPSLVLLSAAPRYGPPVSPDGGGENELLQSPGVESPPVAAGVTRTTKEEFLGLVEQVMKISKSEHVPRLLVNNIELILGLQGENGAEIITSILEDAKTEGEKEDDDGIYTQSLQTIEMILSFAEDFVGQAQEMDGANKMLMGKIMKAMVKLENDTSVSGGEGRNLGEQDMASKREEALDRVMKEEKKNFSSGFLRHIEGECDRIVNQAKTTPESARLLDILRMIQTRVLEELGQDLGEAALVLGQLIGYEKEEELLGVLDAGLTVRGKEFALEMASLTEEALDGLSRVPGGADPDLVKKVRFIDRRLQAFLNETNEF
mmetsp:Transcript_26978/g.59302  ORF Transcript_26978/g.59302 Transcript_26978/m.59302 type:complete len:371 (+) Transcript_26978:139-1251(+)|eukprot:CAMPEP_0168307736 /NCGR_PEP_ID=MMETSP0142_2-20121227/59242_1 /TAXON_ID=44445 /ORGANISM="Pseudo-nitzschia australis, Strain 10249 10 AB" /LENGTH=370 /DNA_ID=CAMNT_0008259925 /DNA_START=74 /DNA_END=1186 /DNA_ORIENTATION=-